MSASTWPDVTGVCPACRRQALRLNSEGNVVCTMPGCPAPASAGLALAAEQAELRSEAEWAHGQTDAAVEELKAAEDALAKLRTQLEALAFEWARDARSAGSDGLFREFDGAHMAKQLRTLLGGGEPRAEGQS